MNRRRRIDSFFAPPEPKNVLCDDGLQGELSRIDSSWAPLIDRWRADGHEFEIQHTLTVSRWRSTSWILPRHPLRALSLTPRSKVRVAIIGDCPSSKGNIADGLAFSSLLPWQYSTDTAALIQELQRDLGVVDQSLTSLDHWARQGVLLLNLVLTVEHENSMAHSRRGWEELTKAIVLDLYNDPQPKAFLFWGRAPRELVDELKMSSGPHLILTAGVPNVNAPIREGSFGGCRHFSKVNEFLRAYGEKIVWARDCI